MDEYMESEPSGIFWVKLVAKNIVLGSPETHFMHMKVKGGHIFSNMEYSFRLQIETTN